MSHSSYRVPFIFEKRGGSVDMKVDKHKLLCKPFPFLSHVAPAQCKMGLCMPFYSQAHRRDVVAQRIYSQVSIPKYLIYVQTREAEAVCCVFV